MAGKEVTPTDEFVKGLWRDNPVFVHVLGMCPALAVSNTAMNALAMGLATTFVLLMAGLSVSLLRNFIPREARIVCYICIIATFVTSVDYLIMALSLEIRDLPTLSTAITRLEQLPNVVSVRRKA